MLDSNFLVNIAEQRIADAIAAGELDDLPGNHKPLRLDADSHIPPDQRMAMRVLKNAGLVPPQVSLRREIALLEDQLQRLRERPDARAKVEHYLAKLQMLRITLDRCRHPVR